MSTWTKTFAVAAPIERTWAAFTDPDEVSKLMTPPEGSGGISHAGELSVLEVVPMELHGDAGPL